MSTIWVLVTNGSVGKILELKKHGGEVSEIENFLRQSSTSTESNDPIYQEKPDGRRLHHVVDYSRDVKDHERELFTKEIVAFLEKALSHNRYQKLVVVASQKILGALRQELPNTVKKLIEHELDKDLITPGLSNQEIVEKIQSDLGLVHL